MYLPTESAGIVSLLFPKVYENGFDCNAPCCFKPIIRTCSDYQSTLGHSISSWMGINMGNISIHITGNSADVRCPANWRMCVTFIFIFVTGVFLVSGNSGYINNIQLADISLLSSDLGFYRSLVDTAIHCSAKSGCRGFWYERENSSSGLCACPQDSQHWLDDWPHVPASLYVWMPGKFIKG